MEIGAKAMRIATHLPTILEAMRQVDGTKAVLEDIASRVEDLPYRLERTKRIKVNAAFSQQQVTVLLRDSRRVSGVTIGDWRLSLTTNMEEVRRPYSRQACAILYAQPLNNAAGYPLGAIFGATSDVDNVAWAHPTVMVYKEINPMYRHITARYIRHQDNSLFDMIRRNDLIGLALFLTPCATPDASISPSGYEISRA